MIKFSVLIPVYNVEKYLNECVDSVLNQTFQNFEIVLVNDGSTDSSGEICNAYAGKDTRIKVFHQGNQGLLSTRRTLLSRASGSFCLFLDSDDFWDADLLSKVNCAIEEFDPDILIFRYKTVSEKGSLISFSPLISENNAFFSGVGQKKLFNYAIDSTWINSLCNKVIRRTLFDIKEDYSKYKGLKSGEDLLQTLPVFLKAERIVCITDPLYNYRKVSTGITGNFNPDFFKEISIVRGVVLDYMKLFEMSSDEYLKRFYRNYLDSVSGYIHRLSCSGLSRQKVSAVFREIKTSKLFVEAYEDVNDGGFSLETGIRYKLFMKKRYETLLLYENIVRFLKTVKKYFFCRMSA